MSFVCLSYIVPHSLIKALFHHIDSLRNDSGVTFESMFTMRVKFWKHIGGVKRKVPPSMRKMCGFTSSCTRAKSRPEKCSPLKHYIVSKDSVCWQRRPWSDCADAQADQGLRCPHMPEDTFSHGAAPVAVLKYVRLVFTWCCKRINALHVWDKKFSSRRFENNFLFFPEKRLRHFIEVISKGFHEIAKPVFLKK